MKNGSGIRILKAILLGVLFVCLCRLGQAYCQSVEQQKKQEKLIKMTEAAAVAETMKQAVEKLQENVLGEVKNTALAKTDGADTGQADNGKAQSHGKADKPGEKEKESASASGIPGEEGGYPILDRYQALYIQNGDLAGWLSIEGMKIDYPVMQCEDDEYYLHHDFEGKDSKYGCLYVRERANLEEGTNFVIYGHNMKDGSMFGDLDLYREEDFYKEHSKISFDTLYKEYTYEIVAVFLSQIYNENDDVFKYYQFYEAQTEAEFYDFYENIKEMSLYDTGVEAAYGDTFLTLSTCAYHVKNGRLAVVAKRVE